MRDYLNYIREVSNFPKDQVQFKDISPLLADPVIFQSAIDDLVKMIDLSKVDLFVGIESRGFIFASALAIHAKKGFLPLRKAGKLPPPVISESYELEYGIAKLEINPAPKRSRVIICDDVLATGGTLKASISLCEKAGYEVIDVLVLINLVSLNDMIFKNQKIKSLINY